MKKSAIAGFVMVGLLAAGGCSFSVGKDTVSKDDVVKQVTDYVDNNVGKPDKVDCPELEAEKDKSVTCTADVSGDEYKVKVTVTEVTDDQAKFDLELVDSGAPTTTETTTESTRRTTSSRRTTTTESAESTTEAGEPGFVAAADVAQQIDQQLTAQVGRSPDAVECPDDLEASLDATLICALTDGADVYDVYITVTSVEGTDVLFDIEVASSPR